jgi:glucose-1-phosphate thymidylyltransferase
MVSNKSGVILAGGHGTRLLPLTKALNKSLLNLNGKAVIDYPLNTLKQMGIENVTIVLGGEHFEQVVNYLEDGERYGMNLTYKYQGAPSGISHALNLCKNTITTEQFVCCLGDNLFENPVNFTQSSGAQIALHKHPELTRFGVASIKDDKIFKIEEKPKTLDPNFDNYAVTGCYLFDQKFFEYFKESKKSQRGEFEISDIISRYLADGTLSHTYVSGEWLDSGTHESMAYANNFYYQKSQK